MKFLAASVPRSVRTARLGHLRTDAIIGVWYIQNPGGGNQVFDVIMQEESEFMRTKTHLATPNMNAAMQQGQANAPYVLKDIKQIELSENDSDPLQKAVIHFRKEFKIG